MMTVTREAVLGVDARAVSSTQGGRLVLVLDTLVDILTIGVVGTSA